jgi:hypothetical protein
MIRRSLLFGAFAFSICGVSAAEYRVGAAQVKITPEVGTPLAGYYSERAMDGIHDDLYAKSLVIHSGGVTIAIVACDLLHIPVEIIRDARTAITAATGIPAANVLISATHTHTGPDLRGGLVQTAQPSPGRILAQQYIKRLPGLLAQSVQDAQRKLQPARLQFGAGHEETISFNRRFFMLDGTVGWNPGKRNPKIVRPAGPIDSEVPVIFAESLQGAPIATLVNFALHLDTVGGTSASADYPLTLSSILQGVKGSDMTTLFTLGTAGNINHIDVSHARPQKGDKEAARIGTVLAAEVLKTYTRMTEVPAAEIRVASRAVPLPLVKFNDADLAWARSIESEFGKPGQAPFYDLVRAFKILELAKRNGQPIDAEVQVFTMGGTLAFVGLPGEIFVELGTIIKQASPFAQTAVISLANGAIGYVPDRKAYAQGAYEVISARPEEGSGELLVKAAVELLNDLFKQAAPPTQ